MTCSARWRPPLPDGGDDRPPPGGAPRPALVGRLSGKVRVRRAYVRGEYGTTKSRRGFRAVPLADRVGAGLEALSRRSAFTVDDELVFGHPQTGAPLDRSKVSKRFKAAVKRAGVRDVRFHDLRHTFGTRMAAVGVPMRSLQEWMGHADFKTTLIYADYSPDERRDRALVARAFQAPGSRLSETESNSDAPIRSECGREHERHPRVLTYSPPEE